MKITTPRERARQQAEDQLDEIERAKIQRAMDSVALPRGMEWSKHTPWLKKMIYGDPCWIVYIFLKDSGVGAHVKTIRIEYRDRESKDHCHLLDRFISALNTFQEELTEGRATYVLDGKVIPDDCKFKPNPGIPTILPPRRNR